MTDSNLAICESSGKGMMDTEVLYDTVQIQEILDHRYPFLMVDRIVSMKDGEEIIGIKNVTFNEPFFTGHFPERPVMPGVLIAEALAQVGGVMAKKSTDGVKDDHFVFLVGVDSFKWKKQVVPGDTLVLKMESIRRRRPLWVMKGTATVNGEVVATGTISAAESPKASV